MQNDVSIVLCGEAGQGIQTIEQVLTRLLKLSGYHVFATKEYMSRVRGGTNSTSICVSARRVNAYLDRIDLLIALSPGRTDHLNRRISPTTIILGEKELGGDKLFANTVAIGAVARLLSVDRAVVEDQIRRRFAGKEAAVIEGNLQAVQSGYEVGEKLPLKIDWKPDGAAAGEILISGAEALSLGALAGGCNFIAAYPMTPSTGVMTFLSQHAREFGIIAEQAEDEIAAMNMALGAWYAGGRALVSTAGGGFALMVEGLSLAGMIESPVVINLGQRPAPATGLPTRTEQGDLNLALYSGHGEFPRAILAPGNIEEAFSLAQHAFNLAGKFQVPVFLMTDQYLMDSYYNLPQFDLSGKVENAVVQSAAGYQRYVLTENGISPRAIPGNGGGLVMLDSDEHDADGHITEDLELRTKMVDKRLKKKEGLTAAALAPELVGPADYKVLVVGWGSNLNLSREALAQIGRPDIAYLHFRQVYPLHPETLNYLNKAGKVIGLENNATGQFCRLVRAETGYEIKDKILKYNGLPFSVEELAAKIGALL